MSAQGAIRLGIAGYGVIGKRHAEEARRHPEFTLVTLIDPVAPEADAAALEAVRETLDAVILATPSALHVDHAITAAERGWHMIIEKPVAHSLAAAERIEQAVARAGVQALVGHHRRHHRNMVRLREMLRAGAIGQVVSASLLWLTRKPDAYFDVDWRKGSDGSPVMMNLVHDIDLLRYLLGEVTQIVGLHGEVQRAGADRNENGALALAFDSGATATIAFADCAASPWGFERGTGESPAIPATRADMLFLAGTRGAISYPSMTLWGGAQDWSELPQAQACATADTVPFQAQLDHFADVIRGRAAPRITIAEARATLAATLEAEDILARHRRRI